MKRKLALLLAVVMTLTVMPTLNVFASSDNKLSTTYASVEESTLLYQPGTTPVPSEEGDVSVARSGVNLIVKFDQAVTSNTAFSLELSNAKFFFRDTRSTAPGAANNYSAITGAGVAAFTGLAAEIGAARVGDDDGYEVADGVAADDTTYFTSGGIWLLSEGTYRGYYVPSRQALNVATNGAFVLAVQDDESKAEVLVLTPGTDVTLTIPLVILTDDETQPVTVTLRDTGSAGASGTTMTIVAGSQGATTAKIDGVATGRDSVTLEKITITETRTRTLGKTNGVWKFRIDAPSGYEFDADLLTNTGIKAYNIHSLVVTPGAVMGAGGVIGTAANSDIRTYNNNRRIDVTMPAVSMSSIALGRIEIEGLTLTPINDNTWGDITGLRVSNLEDSGISEYTFGVVGRRAEYTVTLEQANAKDEVKDLYTGVLVEVASGEGLLAQGLEDEAFQLLEVKIKETSAHSWLTTRKTTLTLPEGVLVRSVKVTAADNTAVGARKDNSRDMGTSSGGLNVDASLITIDKNKIELGNINGVLSSEDKTCSITLKIWVSISQKLAGQDIALSLTGGGIPTDLLPEPLVVARAVEPVTVETKVSTVAVGRNNQRTEDIVITENEAGALAYGKKVAIAVVDQYGVGIDDVNFANADYEVTEGDIDVDLTVGSGGSSLSQDVGSNAGKIVLEVKSDSTEASTIVLSDVRVSTKTSLPSTDKDDSFRILVFGDAITNNYASGRSWKDGFFDNTKDDAGIFLSYMKTSNSGTVGGFDPTTPFKITTDPSKGAMYFEIDGAQTPLLEEYYPRNVNGTILVPVRLVSEAFGCKVSWDPLDEVATIVLREYPSEIVQFTKGSPRFVKNGVPELMTYDAAGTVVATADVYDGRLFVPLRFMGWALGVERSDAAIGFDSETGIASFN